MGEFDSALATVPVDRLVHHSEAVVVRGESYRLKGNAKEVLSDGDER